MRGGHRPKSPQCPLGAIQPLPVNTEEIKRNAWQNDGILVLSLHDCRLSWSDAEYLKQLGDRIYGKGK